MVHAQVGIIHTSYRELSRRNAGLVMAGISTVFNALLCAIHCHKVCKRGHPMEYLIQRDALGRLNRVSFKGEAGNVVLDFP